MGKIKASYVTDKGKQMLFSGSTVNYTKAVLYSQDVSNLAVSELRQLTSLTGELMTTPVGVSDKQDGSTSSVNVEATFTNAGLDHDIEFHSVGWFAKQGEDGTETLMAVQVANNGANLAAGSPNGATDAVDLTLSFAIGDTTTVTAVIDPAGSPTFTDLHNSANDIRSELHTALATKADKSDLEPLAKSADVNKALDTKADKSQLPDLTPYAKTVDVNASLDNKADKQTVADDLAKKADQSDVNEKLATKADTEAVDEALSKKADKTDLDPLAKSADVAADVKSLQASIDTKADQDATTKALATKADQSTIDSNIKSINDELALKANISDVSKNLATKANQSDLDATNAEVAKKANSQDVNDALAQKDDVTDVDKKIATVTKSVSDLTDTVSANKVATDSALSTKANASDVADNVKTLQANIDTKADKATVDAEIAKIDFTPYAKSADVAKDLQGYTTTADLTKLLAGKRDIADSYSRDELDKKFLQLSTDTSGKVSVDQIAKLLASKVDKTDLTSQLQAITDSIGTKANSANVTAELAKKDNTADVDAKIKTVTDLANTKANSDDVYSKTEANNLITDAKNTGKQAQATADSALAGYNKRPVISGGASDDLLSFKTTQLRYYPGNGNTCKNLPPATNQQWFTVEYIFENPNGDGIAIYRSPDNEIWTIGNNGGNYDQAWVKVANANDIQGLQNQINTKADTSTVNAQIADAKNTAQSNLDKVKSDLNGAINTKANSSDLTALDKKAIKSVGIYPNNLHFESGSFNYWSGEVKASPDANGYALIDLTDDASVTAAANQLNVMLTGLNHLQGKQTKDSADANALSETGVYYCSSPAKNFPVSQWGTLVTSNGNGARASQLYIPDDNSAVWFRTLDGDWRGWVRLANSYEVNNAESSLTSLINAVSNKVNVTVPLFRRITAGNTWNDILGASNGATPVLVSIRDEGGANTLGNFSAAVAFGGGDTKGVLNVAYSDHTARIIGGNGNAPVWHEDIAWKSDINSLNSTISALQQTVQSLQNTINQQATQITGLQTLVNNQANEIKQLQETTIKGKTFSKSQEAAAEAWEQQNSQQIAFILDN